MAAHMLGMAEMAASIRENLRQQRKATQAAGSAGVYIDALTQLQVDERADAPDAGAHASRCPARAALGRLQPGEPPHRLGLRRTPG